MCKFGSKSWTEMSKDIQDAAKFLFEIKLKSELLSRLAKARTIGYALKTDQRTSSHHQITTRKNWRTLATGPKVKLNFIPNQIQYQTYPYIPPGSINHVPVSGTTGTSQLNYLLYAETTDDRTLPDINKRMIPRQGNWTDGTIDKIASNESGDYGSFYLSRQCFFELYLLKKLRKLNRVLEPWHTEVHCHVEDWANPRQNW